MSSVATSPGVFARPMASRNAWAQAERRLSLPRVWTPQPGEGHPRVLAALLRATSAVAGDIHDAHLAALAIAHGLVRLAKAHSAPHPNRSTR